MLACARIGAPHTVVFGGFSSEALRSRIIDCDAQLRDHRGRRLPPRCGKRTQARGRRGADPLPGRANVLVVRRTGQDVAWTEGRDIWWHDLVPAQPEQHTAEPFDSEHPLYVMYTSGTTASPRASCTRPVATSLRLLVQPLGGVRPQGRVRRVLVRRRHRLGHRSQLHRLRAAGQRGDLGDVRGHPGHARQGPLVGDHREVRRHASSTPHRRRSARS